METNRCLNYVKEHKKEILIGAAIGIGGIVIGNAAMQKIKVRNWNKPEKIEVSNLPGVEIVKTLHKKRGGGIVAEHVDIDKLGELKDVFIQEIPNRVHNKVNVMIVTDMTTK